MKRTWESQDFMSCVIMVFEGNPGARFSLLSDFGRNWKELKIYKKRTGKFIAGAERRTIFMDYLNDLKHCQQPMQLVKRTEVQQPFGGNTQILMMPHEIVRNLELQNTAQRNQLERMQQALNSANEEIEKLREGIYGSDWQLIEEPVAKRTWMSDGCRREILMDRIIENVVVYTLYSENTTDFFCEIHFQHVNAAELTICIKRAELFSSKLLQRLEEGGIYLRIKRSSAIKCSLIRRLIAKKITENTFIVEHAGWFGQGYIYCDEGGRQRLQDLRIQIPFMRRCFLGESVCTDQIKRRSLPEITEEGAILLAVAAGGLLCTPLREKGFRLDALLFLERGHDSVNSRKWLQPWKDEICADLSSKKALLEALCESCDEILFLVDVDTKYSLQWASLLNSLVEDGEIINGSKIVRSKTVPVLVTGRYRLWMDRGISLLRLPSESMAKTQASKTVLSWFWKGFCDYLNATYDFWQEQLDSLEIPEYKGELFANVYSWLVASYNVLCPYLQTVLGQENSCIMKILDFAACVNNWLCNAEDAQNLDVVETFVQGLKRLKANNLIEFVRPQVYTTNCGSKHMLGVDFKYVYISKRTFEFIAQKLLPGCTVKDIYGALVESDYAKQGDGAHLFPKCSEKAGFAEGRRRMAHIRRELLLSEAEFLLEV